MQKLYEKNLLTMQTMTHGRGKGVVMIYMLDFQSLQNRIVFLLRKENNGTESTAILK